MYALVASGRYSLYGLGVAVLLVSPVTIPMRIRGWRRGAWVRIKSQVPRWAVERP